MRVLHMDLGRTMRGGQYQVLHLMQELDDRGVDQKLLRAKGSPLPGQDFTVAGLREPWDVIHAHDARSHTWAAVLGRAPLVVSRRVAFPAGTGWLSQWKYRQPAMFLAVSRYVADRLMEAGVPAAKIRVVYDGVALLPESTRSGPVIAPATEDPMKGSDLIRASGVDVEFTNDLVNALRTASGLVYISRQEGLGSAALLAMSAGVPVVGSRVGGLPEVVGHERTGLLVENEPAAIAVAVRRVQGPEGASWGNAGRAEITRRFLTSHMAEATLEVYGELVR